jgi:phage major head subunit gpT-like protein
MSPITTTTMVDALDANLNELFQDGLTSWGEEYSKIFNVENTELQSVKDSYESGFKTMPIKQEGSKAEYDVILPGITKTYVPETYAMGYEITEEAIEDNLRTGETFAKLPQALVRSAMEAIEITSANIFNTGFTTNGFDGVPLFDTAHPDLDGGTQGNEPSTAANLSVTSLTAALTSIEQFTDERGLKRPMKGRLLVVPVNSWALAEELLGSEYKPYSANNEVNAIQKKDLSYFVSHYLTDTNAWFLIAEKGMHALKFFWRVKLGALRRGSDFDTTNLKHLARMRFDVDYSHWRGTYGSPGA